MKGILKHTALLAIITILAGLALGLVHEITLEPIAQAKEQQKQNAYKSVFADADAFEAKDFDQAEADKITSKFGKCSINEVVEAKKVMRRSGISLQSPMVKVMPEIFSLRSVLMLTVK